MNKKNGALLVAMGLCSLSGLALAEGRCPPGYYPVDSPGVAGCAPMPIIPSRKPSEPRVMWVDRWGAIAADGKNAILGTATGMASKRKAQKAALLQCRSKGGLACKVDMAYYNQCAVLVTGDKQFIVQVAATVNEATKLGMKACGMADTNCRIYYADCSLPQRNE